MEYNLIACFSLSITTLHVLDLSFSWVRVQLLHASRPHTCASHMMHSRYLPASMLHCTMLYREHPGPPSTWNTDSLGPEGCSPTRGGSRKQKLVVGSASPKTQTAAAERWQGRQCREQFLDQPAGEHKLTPHGLHTS